MTDISIDVVSSSIIPSSAIKVSSIHTLGNWIAVHDGGTSGWSSGTMSYASSPSLTGTSRLFANQFVNFGGERYSVQFADDTTSQNFFYDTWVYIAGSADGFSNLEFDLDQTMSNGETVVMRCELTVCTQVNRAPASSSRSLSRRPMLGYCGLKPLAGIDPFSMSLGLGS